VAKQSEQLFALSAVQQHGELTRDGLGEEVGWIQTWNLCFQSSEGIIDTLFAVTDAMGARRHCNALQRRRVKHTNIEGLTPEIVLKERTENEDLAGYLTQKFESGEVTGVHTKAAWLS
jgi:hypothetical protein